MLLNSRYDYASLKQITLDNGMRVYETPAGNLPSVTTILSATKDMTELDQWRKRLGDREANRIRDEACALGTLIHTHLESFLMGLPRPSGNNLIHRMAKAMSEIIITQGLVAMSDVWSIEAPLYFPHLYAGTSDLIGVYNGRDAVVDYKSATRMKKSEHITDYFVQGVAYLEAHNEVHKTKIDTVVILMVSRDLDFKRFVIQGKSLDAARRQWHGRVEDWYRCLETSGMALFEGTR